jgi:hypothetical protein
MVDLVATMSETVTDDVGVEEVNPCRYATVGVRKRQTTRSPGNRKLEGGFIPSQSTRIYRPEGPKRWSLQRPHVWAADCRYFGREWVDDQSFSYPLRALRAIKPSLAPVPHKFSYWMKDVRALDKAEKMEWMDRLGVQDESALHRHFRQVRSEVWELVQDFSFARFWFLRSRLPLNPFYDEIIAMAQDGATIADLACGVGQDVRWLREHGASGQIWAVDICPGVWKLGFGLFGDARNADSLAKYLQTDLMKDVSHSGDNACPLHVLHEKVDLFLLNDYLSFLGSAPSTKSLEAIVGASKVGTSIMGWMIGSDDTPEVNMDDPTILGDAFVGPMMHPEAFSTYQFGWWAAVQRATNTKWDVKTEMVELVDFGFMADELKDIWRKKARARILCFLATRLV